MKIPSKATFLPAFAAGLLSGCGMMNAEKAKVDQQDFATVPVQDFEYEAANTDGNSIVVWNRGVRVEDQRAFSATTGRLGAAAGELRARSMSPEFRQHSATRARVEPQIGALSARLTAKIEEITRVTAERDAATDDTVRAELNARLVALESEKTEIQGLIAPLMQEIAPAAAYLTDMQTRQAEVQRIGRETIVYASQNTAFFGMSFLVKLEVAADGSPQITIPQFKAAWMPTGTDVSTVTSQIKEVSYLKRGGVLRFTIEPGDGNRFKFDMARARYTSSGPVDPNFPAGSISYYGGVRMEKADGEIRNGFARFERIGPAPAPRPAPAPSPNS